MRRLVTLIAAVLFVETIFYHALGPLLPELRDELDLSKAQAGLLGAADPIGVAAAAIPAAMVAMRAGVRAVVVTGLLLLAGATVGFGLAGDYGLLLAMRVLQGVAASLCWSACLAWLVGAAPRERRGELLGVALAAAVAGGLLGPVVGGLAGTVGRAETFVGFAVLALVLAIWAAREPRPAPAERQQLRVLVRALRSPGVLTAMWLLLLPAMLLGVLLVIGPLKLDTLGYSALAITLVFVLAALLEAGVHPIVGRWSDRRGRLEPVRVGCGLALVTSVALALVDQQMAFAALVVWTGVGYAVFWAPSMAMLSDETEIVGAGVVLGQALMNLSFAPGNLLGAAAGGALADTLGDAVPFLVVAGLCGLTLLVLRPHLLAVRHAGAGRPAG